MMDAKRNTSMTFQIIMTLLLVSQAGCHNTETKPLAPYQAVVMNFVPGVAPAKGTWEMNTKTLSTLEDPDSLKGTNFEIVTGQKFTIDASVGSLISGRFTGQSSGAVVRYDVKNNTILARDTSTLLLFSSFHTFEKVFEKIEATTGLTAESIKNSIGGKFKIYFEPTIEDGDSQSKLRLSLKLNAAFYSEEDNFLLFRRSELEKIPLAANLKVISHEFGHALFKNSFFEQKNTKCSATSNGEIESNSKDKFFPGRWETEFSISGFNEGFSDFNSYVNTGDNNPIEDSIDFDDLSKRSLAEKNFTFSQLSSSQFCNKKFYCIGTLFARALYAASLQYRSNPSDLQAFSRRVFSALSKTSGNMSGQLLPFPSRSIASCKYPDSISIEYDGKVSGAFLSAFLLGFSATDERNSLCRAFIEQFGSEGFPLEARNVCNP